MIGSGPAMTPFLSGVFVFVSFPEQSTPEHRSCHVIRCDCQRFTGGRSAPGRTYPRSARGTADRKFEIY